MRNTLPSSLKNWTSKFIFEKHIKSHILASQSSQLIIKVNSSKLIICESMTSYLVLLLILDIFHDQLGMLPCGFHANVAKLLANLFTKPYVFYYFAFVFRNLVSIKIIIIVIIIIIIIITKYTIFNVTPT